MYVYMCTSSCVYVQCMYTCYYSLPNYSGDEDVFGDASVPTHRTVMITKLLHEAILLVNTALQTRKRSIKSCSRFLKGTYKNTGSCVHWNVCSQSTQCRGGASLPTCIRQDHVIATCGARLLLGSNG